MGGRGGACHQWHKQEVSVAHAAVALSLVQSLEELIDGRVRQPDGGGRRRQRAL